MQMTVECMNDGAEYWYAKKINYKQQRKCAERIICNTNVLNQNIADCVTFQETSRQSRLATSVPVSL